MADPRGKPPRPSSVPGNITGAQLRYYGKRNVLQALGMPSPSGWTYQPRKGGFKDLSVIDGVLVAGATTNAMRRDEALNFSPSVLDRFNEYARLYPTMDPRAWIPLAQAGVEAGDEAAKKAYLGDQYSQFSNSTYGGIQNQPPNPMGPGQTAAAERASLSAQDQAALAGLAGIPGMDWAQQRGEVTAAAQQGDPEQIAADAEQQAAQAKDAQAPSGITAPLAGLGNTFAGMWDAATNVPETASRAALTALALPYQAVVGTVRTQLGNTDHMYDIARKNGLSEADTLVAFPELKANAIARTIDSVTGRSDINLFGAPTTVEDLPPERAKAVLQAQKEWGELQPTLPSIWDQTDLGQVVHDKDLLLSPEKGGDGWLPGPDIWQRTDEASGRMFDVRSDDVKARDKAEAVQVQQAAEMAAQRTEQAPSYKTAYDIVYGGQLHDPAAQQWAEQYMEASHQAKAAILSQAADQVARIVAPVGWTMGRGLASVWMDSDTTEFQTISGLADIGASLGLDPVNLIPAAPFAKALRLRPGTLTRAFEPGGKMALGRTTISRSGEAVPGAAMLSKGSTDLSAIEEVKALGGKVYSDGVLKKNANGKVITPHKVFLAPERVLEFFGSPKGQRLVDEIAKIDSPHELMVRSGMKMDAELARTLAAANNPAAVRAAIATRSSALRADMFGRLGKATSSVVLFKGKTFEDFSHMRGVSWMLGGSADDSRVRRLFREVPRPTGINFEDKDSAYRQLYRWTNTAGLTSDELKAPMDAMLASTNRAEFYQSVTQAFDLAMGRLRGFHGITDADAARLTRFSDEWMGSQERAYFNSNLTPDKTYGAGDGNVGNVMLMNEMLNNDILLPDYRMLQRAVGMTGRLRNHMPGTNRSGIISKEGTREVKKTWDAYIEDGMVAFTSAWKYSVLTRLAYMIRNSGEMTLAASLAGRNGLMSHPAAFAAGMISATASKDAASVSGRLAKSLMGMDVGATGTAKGIYDTLAFPARLTQDVIDSLGLSNGVRGLLSHMDLNQMRVSGGSFYQQVRGGESQVVLDALSRGLSTTYGNLSTIDEPLGRSLSQFLATAQRGSRDGGKGIYAASSKQYREAFIGRLLTGNGDPTIRDILDPSLTTRQVLKRFRETNKDIRSTMRPDLLNGSMARDRKFIEGLRDNILPQYHQGDPVIMEAIRTGKFEGENLLDSPKFDAYIAKRMAEKDGKFQEAMPPYLNYMDTQDPGKVGALKDFVTDFFRSAGEVDDIVARSPLLREVYLERVGKLAPYMSAAERSRVIGELRKGGDHVQARLIGRTRREPGGTLTAEDIHASATGAALKEAERTFYDAHRRQNWALMARIAAPFAQSAANTVKRWGVLSMQSPNMYYRTMKPVTALQQPGSAVIYDLLGAATGDQEMQSFYTADRPDLSVDGYFYTNEFGEREFVYPALGPIARWLPLLTSPRGAEFKSSLGALNVQQGGAGTGPMITLAASVLANTAIYHDDPMGAFLRSQFPYGLPEGNLVERTVEALFPTIGRKLVAAFDDERLMPLIVQTMGTLSASGKYDLTSPRDMQRLQNDAQHLATNMSVFSAFAGSVTPSTVNPKVLLEVSKAGDPRAFLMQEALADEYRKYIAADYDMGTQLFIEDYGATALLSVLPTTVTDGTQATNDLWVWRSQNGDSYDAHKDIAGLFFGGGDPVGSDDGLGGNDFNRELLSWQQSTGERRKRSADEMQSMVQVQMGWMLWNNATAKLAADPSLSRDAVAVQRAIIREDIGAKYPQWSPRATKDQVNKQINSLHNLFDNPDEGMEDTPGYAYLKAYMEERDATLRALQAQGVTSLSTQAAQQARGHLVDVGVRLMRADTSNAFTNAWNRVFSQELGGEDIAAKEAN